MSPCACPKQNRLSSAKGAAEEGLKLNMWGSNMLWLLCASFICRCKHVKVPASIEKAAGKKVRLRFSQKEESAKVGWRMLHKILYVWTVVGSGLT